MVVNSRVKKAFFSIIGLCLVAVVGFNGSHKEEEYYLKINEKNVGQNEVDFTLTNLKAVVVSSIQSQYGLTYDEKFWDTQINETTPRKILEEKATEILVRNTMYEELLKEKDLLQYKDFEEFNELLSQVNKEREEAVKRKEVIYGPINYNQFDYYNYLMSNSLIKLREAYRISGEVEVTEEILKTFEKQNPDIISSEPDTFKTKLLYASFVDEKGVVSADKKLQCKQVMDEVYALLEEGETLEEIEKRYLDVLNLEERMFGGVSNRTDLMSYGELVYELKEIEKNEYTNVLQANGSYNIALLVEKVDGEKRPFEEYKDFLTSKYIEDYVERLVEEKMTTAKIEILKPLF